jgi:hypothetical protein
MNSLAGDYYQVLLETADDVAGTVGELARPSVWSAAADIRYHPQLQRRRRRLLD